MKKLVTLFIFVFILCLKTSYAGEGIYLAYNSREGDVSSYQMTALAENKLKDVGKFTSEQTVNWDQKVIKVKGDIITAKIVITYSQGIMRSEDIQEKEVPIDMGSLKEGDEYFIKFRKNGEVVESNQEALEESILNQLIFPKTKLKIGDSWNLGNYTTCKLIDFVKYKGYDCAKIEVKSIPGKLEIPGLLKEVPSLQSQDFTMHSTDGIVYFAYKEGKMVESKTKSILNIEQIWKEEGKVSTASIMETIVELVEK
ncbi:hypothetical protein KKB84_03540 [bacterium]|nr:hypothetical protein [bacterium]